MSLPSDSDAWDSLGSMEGLYEVPVSQKNSKPVEPVVRAWPGYATVAAITIAAFALHAIVLPLLSSGILAIIGGLVLRNLFRLPGGIVLGAKAIVKRTLPATIIFTGASMNLLEVGKVGAEALLITTLSMAIAALTAWFAGKWIGSGPRTNMLIAAGTAICGTSAIAAVAPLVDADEEDLTLSIAAINLLGLILMFSFPFLGALFGMSEKEFGIWAGSSIHAVPQVVTAGFAFGEQAGAIATLVKLMRVSLLAPILFSIGLITARQRKDVKVHYMRLVPNFVWGFFGLSVLNTFNLLPTLTFEPLEGIRQAAHLVRAPKLLNDISNILLTLSMAAIGLEVSAKMLFRSGARAFATAAIACLALVGASLFLVSLIASR